MKEKILEAFKDSLDKVLSFDEISNYLGTKRNLEKTLKEMMLDGLLFETKQNKFALSSFFGLKLGKIIKASKNGLVAKCLDNDDTYYINSIASNGAILNDKVYLSFNKFNTLVHSIVEEFKGPITGTINKGRRLFVRPFNDNLPLIDLKDKNIKIDEGAIVSVKIVSRFPNLYGEIEEVLGHKNSLDTKLKVLLKDYNVNKKFSDEVLSETNYLYELNEFDSNRLDLTNKLVITIDGENAKDLDDAISIEKDDNENFILGVHIADVSHYVQRYSLIDKEALNRGTSIYLGNMVVPMLPEILSNDLCSLNPNTKKLSLSVIMKINKNGEVIDYDIKESIIKSSYRLSYKQVNSFLNDSISINKEVDYLLNTSYELSLLLEKVKENRGEIRLDIKEPYFEFDEKGYISNIFIREENKGERIIEDFMVLANETVASFIFYQDKPMIYRVHESPDISKYNLFSNILCRNKILIRKIQDNIYPKDYQNILKSISDSEISSFISILMLRSMPKAKYLNINLGHFGLASECYTHFTSPIRRYPDLMVHRLVKYYLNNEKINDDKLNQELSYICDISSNAEQKALEIERKSDDIMMAIYMKDKIGNQYKGYVSGIVDSGFFVTLYDNCVEGYVRFDSINKDYFIFDEESYCAIGQNNKHMIKLGQKVDIILDKVNLITNKIDFILKE